MIKEPREEEEEKGCHAWEQPMEHLKRQEMHSNHKRHDKYAASCYHDQVSSISSYRCKRNDDDCVEERPVSREDAEKNLWLNVIARKEKDIKREIYSNIIECKQSLAECNEKLSLTLDQAIPILKAARRLLDYQMKRSMLIAWTRFTLRLKEIGLDAKKISAAIVLQSKWRRQMMKKQYDSTMITIIQIQCFVRKLIARRRLGGLKKKRKEALLVREQLVRAYVARCQRRKSKEKRMHNLGLVREKALRGHVARYKRRKLRELEHNAAITCQSAIRGFVAKRQLQEIARVESIAESERQPTTEDIPHLDLSII
eukprot:scaffold4041_cov117-Skeletonema_dohrnii-CCMP3373.AAC.7